MALNNTAGLLEGKVLASAIQEQVKADLASFQSRGLEVPALASIQVSDDPSSSWYISQQEKLAAKLGIRYQRISAPGEIKTQDQLTAVLSAAGKNPLIHGIFLAMPLPKNFNARETLRHFEPSKDVEGITPASLGMIVLRESVLIPPTAYASLKLIEHALAQLGKNLKGLKAVLVGQSAIVGRPLQLLLAERRLTTTVCNTGTTQEDLQKAVSESDIVVACAGQPGLVKGAWIKPGAIVIDVGTTEVAGKLTGDVEFEEAVRRASLITPVPGGVGPLTVTMLMQNLILAYKWQKGLAN